VLQAGDGGVMSLPQLTTIMERVRSQQVPLAPDPL
jgi:hypothetical protein